MYISSIKIKGCKVSFIKMLSRSTLLENNILYNIKYLHFVQPFPKDDIMVMVIFNNFSSYISDV